MTQPTDMAGQPSKGPQALGSQALGSQALGLQALVTQTWGPQTWGPQARAGQTTLALWAPAAATVSVLQPDGSRAPMQPAGEGWHVARMDLPPGSRYRFACDGTTVPDPASRSQPDGPEGWSAVTDRDAYRWTDTAWVGRPWHETVLYELHVGTFSREGNSLGAIPNLDHLVALGVTMIELMPVAAFPGAYNWGYDGVLPYAPHHGYGSPDDLKRLVDACHARGLSVVLDVVYNHFGPTANMIPDYAPGFFTQRHKTPWGEAIDFDSAHAGPVREFFVQNAIYWVREFHMDGLRLDAVQAVFDDGPEHILDELARRVHAAVPDRAVHLTLENDKNDARWLNEGYVAQWNDDFHHVMRVLVARRRDGYYVDYTDAPLRRLGQALAEGFSYQGEESTHRPGLHRGTPSAHLPPTAFVNFLQNHDQVGNTPFGCRLTDLAPDAAVRLGTAVMLLAPGIPMLFMGEEWGSARPFDFFCDYPEKLANMVRNGRREEFSHLPEFSDPAALTRLTDPNAASTRSGSTLDWAATDEPLHAAWLAFHRQLLAVRREAIVPLLPQIAGSAGGFHVLETTDAEGAGALAVTWRLSDGRRLVMAANFSDQPVPWQPPSGRTLFQLVGTAAPLAAWDLVVVLEGAS